MSNPRKQNGHRWRQLRARVLATETHCALCTLPVDKTLPPHDPGAPEVDHKTPLSRGGHPYARNNAQLAHRGCNQRKSNKLEPQPQRTQPQAPQPTRHW